MWFDFGREEKLPTQYPAKYYPATVDMGSGINFQFWFFSNMLYFFISWEAEIKGKYYIL